MHVVQCLTHSSVGGGQAVVYTLVSMLQRYHPDLRLTVVLPSGGVYVKRFRDLGIKVVEFPFDRLSPLNFFKGAKLLWSLDADVVHSHGKGAGLYTRFLGKQRSLMRLVHSYHGFYPPKHRLLHTAYVLAERFFSERLDAIVAASAVEARDIGQSLRHVGNMIRVIPHIIDSVAFEESSLAPLPSDLLSFFANGSRKFFVCMIARGDAIKNYPLACTAARLVLTRFAHVRFCFIGIRDNSSVVSSLVAEFPDRVRVLASVDTTAAVMKRCHAILLTSRKESFGLVILEAFALGKPVVGTDVGAINELVWDGVNGLLCGETAGAVAEAIGRIVDDEALYAHLSKGAAASAKRADERLWSDQYYQLYQSTGW